MRAGNCNRCTVDVTRRLLPTQVPTRPDPHADSALASQRDGVVDLGARALQPQSHHLLRTPSISLSSNRARRRLNTKTLCGGAIERYSADHTSECFLSEGLIRSRTHTYQNIVLRSSDDHLLFDVRCPNWGPDIAACVAAQFIRTGSNCQ